MSKGFTRNYSEVKNLKAFKEDPLVNIDRHLMIRVFKMERKKMKNERKTAATDQLSTISQSVGSKRNTTINDFFEPDQRPTKRECRGQEYLT